MTRRRAAAVGAFLLVLLILGCSSAPPQPPDPGGTANSGRVIIPLTDRGQGFAAFAITPGPLSMALNDSITVTVLVCGSQAQSAGCAVESGRPSSAPVGTAATDVLIQADLSADPAGPTGQPSSSPSPSAGDGPSARITSKDAERQPLAGPTATASWTWLVTPDRMGSYALTVRLTSQRGITTIALPEQALTIDLAVHEPRTSNSTSLVDRLFVVSIAIFAILFFVLLLFIIAAIRRRYRQRSADAETWEDANSR